MGYFQDAKDDAKSTAEEFKDQIVEMLLDDGKASDDLHNDYPSGDSYHHESHVDRDYNLSDAAAVLDELHQYQETDSGLWDGQDPRRAVATMAAFTYGNAVLSMWSDLISEINDDSEVQGILDDISMLEKEADEMQGMSPEEALGDVDATQEQLNEAEESLRSQVEELREKLPEAVQSVIDGF